jgi:dTDP-glucose pyrophosphorylase
MKEYSQHLISVKTIARDAIKHLTNLPNIESRTLFVIDDKDQMVGTLTDGDIRRGLIDGLELSDSIFKYMNHEFKYLINGKDFLQQLSRFRKLGIEFVPLLDEHKSIVRILDLKILQTVLPASALLMAGGRGERLKPLTDNVPKPMLIVGDKPILEHNIDRLRKFGISEFFISVNYLASQIMDYFGDGSDKDISITYVREDTPLGTLGSLGLIESISNEYLLVMNSDLLTNLDYEDFFMFYLDSKADMCIASVPYQVNIPYAVLETEGNRIQSFKEKPRYTYYSNAGIYFFKSELKNQVPVKQLYNATDLMQDLINDSKSVIHYPILNYWLDIGKHHDFLKAQDDFAHIKF